MITRKRDPTAAKLHLDRQFSGGGLWKAAGLPALTLHSNVSSGRFHKLGSPFRECPCNKNPTYLGSVLGPLTFGNFHVERHAQI